MRSANPSQQVTSAPWASTSSLIFFVEKYAKIGGPPYCGSLPMSLVRMLSVLSPKRLSSIILTHMR
ncbi:MAG: hypothetical protein ACK56F_23900, partial [bacterium]